MSKGHGSFFKKTLVLGVTLGAGIAVVSPFIWFNQAPEQSPSEDQNINNSQPTISIQETSSADQDSKAINLGEIINKDQALAPILNNNIQDSQNTAQNNNEPDSDCKQQYPSAKLNPNSSDNPAQNIKEDNKVTKEDKAEQDKDTPKAKSKEESPKEDKAQQDKDTPKAKSKEESSKEDKAQQDKDTPKAKTKEESSKEDKAQQDKDTPKAKSKEESSKEDKAQQDKDTPKVDIKEDILEKQSEQMAVPKLDLKEETITENQVDDSQLNSSVKNKNNAKEELSEDNQTLEQKVASLSAKRSKKDQEKYEEEQKLRQEYVDSTVQEIALNSRIYLPPMFSSRAIIVYFSPTIDAPKDPKKHKGTPIDSKTGATLLKNQELLRQNPNIDLSYHNPEKIISGTEFIAKTLAFESQSLLYNISTVTNYPSNVDQLYKMALNEKKHNQRPELTDDLILDIDNIDCIYICYPIWWSDLPAAIYSFFDKFDLSGKTIIPIIINDDEPTNTTIDTIASLEPNASIYNKGLKINFKEFKNPDELRVKLRTWLSNISQELN